MKKEEFKLPISYTELAEAEQERLKELVYLAKLDQMLKGGKLDEQLTEVMSKIPRVTD